jgi:HSF-type DNA-binding
MPPYLLVSIGAAEPPYVEPVDSNEPTTRREKQLQRKAKNFAERLMHVLKDGIGKDTVWWVGDGKAVAIHTRNLKDGDLLSQHFRVKDYSVFIRNCNRW